MIGNPKHFAQVERKIIHIDIDPSSISKRVKVDIPIVGDVKDVLQELIARSRKPRPARRGCALGAVVGQINEWRKRECLVVQARPGRRHQAPAWWSRPSGIMTKDVDAYITSDVGQHQMWAAQYYRFEDPRRWINSGGLGTMGVGLPYAMGIKLAKPDADVFCVTGEGSHPDVHPGALHLPAVQNAGQDRRLNNRYLGMVRQWQEFDYGKAATPTATWMRCPISSSWPRPTATSAC